MTSPDFPFLPRLIETRFQEECAVMPVVVLTGARQTGKSTFVSQAPAGTGRAYQTLDDPPTREIAETNPRAFVNVPERLTIDEVQRVPELLSAIKLAVDTEHQRETGHFVLTGSANLLLMRQVNETLAGRAAYLTLWPLTRREQLGLGCAGIWSDLLHTPWKQWRSLVQDQSVPSEDWHDLARRGGYPRPITHIKDPRARARWFAGYINTYLDRDVPSLANIENLPDFRRLMRLTALQIGTLLNQTELARQAEMPLTTVQRYLNLLEISYQIVRLPAYAVSRKLRLIKSPKVYWSDIGLALALTGDRQPGGAHLENIVAHDLWAWRTGEVSQTEIMYWRTKSGREVDFVIDSPSGLLAIEVKSTRRPATDDSAGVRAFIDEYGDAVLGGLVLHGGTETFWIAERVLATPWWRVV